MPRSILRDAEKKPAAATDESLPPVIACPMAFGTVTRRVLFHRLDMKRSHLTTITHLRVSLVLSCISFVVVVVVVVVFVLLSSLRLPYLTRTSDAFVDFAITTANSPSHFCALLGVH